MTLSIPLKWKVHLSNDSYAMQIGLSLVELWNTDLLLGIHLIGNPSRKIKNEKHNKGDYEGHSPILCEQYENRRVCDIVLSL